MKRKKWIGWLFVFFALQLNTVLAQVADTAQATQLLTTANAQIEALNHQKAIDLSQKAIQIYEKIDPEYYQLGYAYNVMGDAWYEMGAIDKAMAYFMNAENILRNHYPEPNLEVAQSLNFLGLCHWRKGALDSAADYFQEAMMIRKGILGLLHPKVADGYNNFGNISLAQGNISQALSNYQNGLKIRTKTLGHDHLDVASSLNNMGTCFSRAGEYQRAFELYQDAFVIREKKLGKDHPKIAQTLLNMGDCYLQQKESGQALTYFNQALDILEQHPTMNEIEIAKAYNYLGSSYSQMGNQEKALPFFEKSLKIQQAHNEPNSPNFVAVYNNLANAFEQLGDYQKALVYYQNNLHILSTNPSYGAQHPLTAITHNNIGQVQVKFNNFQQALNSHSQALNIFQTRNNGEQIAETLRHIGNVFFDAGEEEMAIQNFQSSLDLRKALGQEGELSNAYIFQNLGNGYSNQGQYDLALSNYQKAHLLMEQYYEKDHPILVPFKTRIGGALQQKGDYVAALTTFEKALDLLKINPTSTELPDFIESPIEVLQLLLAKGNTHLAIYHQSKKQSELTTALSHFDYAIRLTQQVRTQYQEVQSKIALGEIAYDNFVGSIKACYLLLQATNDQQYLEKAFAYSEQSRSSLVLEALNTSSATTFSGIPDSLIQQEHNLKVEITFYEKKKQLALQNGSADNQDLLDEYNHKIFQNKQLYERLIQRFETEFPAYYELKYKVNLPTILALQKDLLTPDHSLLEYFVADTSTFVFVINKDEASMKELSIGIDTLSKQVSLLRKYIHAYYTDTQQQTGDAFQKALRDYTSLGYRLYESIMQPVENQLAVKLTIINGSILNFLPFEALIASPVKQVHKPKSYNYLLKNYEISYGYSANLLHRLSQNSPVEYEQSLLAFAPEFSTEDRRNLAPLAYNIPEVNAIAGLINGTTFIGPDATKNKFEELARLYQIIHLSTHGQSDMRQGDYSYLAFVETDSTQEDLLYAKDIYNLDLQADLVVLSACETGTGEVSRSEGAISLGRAFFYSGAKSILNTLWSVDDASTGELMRQFYTDIRDGFTRSTALRKAKLTFIEEGKYAHPYYWSAFMLIGEREEISLSKSFNWQIFLGPSLLLFFGIGWFGFKKYKN